MSQEKFVRLRAVLLRMRVLDFIHDTDVIYFVY